MIIAVHCKQPELRFGITIDHWRLKLPVESPTTDAWEDWTVYTVDINQVGLEGLSKPQSEEQNS